MTHGARRIILVGNPNGHGVHQAETTITGGQVLTKQTSKLHI